MRRRRCVCGAPPPQGQTERGSRGRDAEGPSKPCGREGGLVPQHGGAFRSRRRRRGARLHNVHRLDHAGGGNAAQAAVDERLGRKPRLQEWGWAVSQNAAGRRRRAEGRGRTSIPAERGWAAIVARQAWRKQGVECANRKCMHARASNPVRLRHCAVLSRCSAVRIIEEGIGRQRGQAS